MDNQYCLYSLKFFFVGAVFLMFPLYSKEVATLQVAGASSSVSQKSSPEADSNLNSCQKLCDLGRCDQMVGADQEQVSSLRNKVLDSKSAATTLLVPQAAPVTLKNQQEVSAAVQNQILQLIGDKPASNPSCGLK